MKDLESLQQIKRRKGLQRRKKERSRSFFRGAWRRWAWRRWAWHKLSTSNDLGGREVGRVNQNHSLGNKIDRAFLLLGSASKKMVGRGKDKERSC